jgi:hypothetical protein
LSEDKNLRELLLQATKDPAFRTKFLKNPEAVAKEAGVKLKAEYLDRVKKTAAFIESLDDLRLPPGPIYYPVDDVLTRWKITELTDVLKYSIIEKWKWIFYPADILNIAKLREIERRR